MSLAEQLKLKEQETLFNEYKKIGYGVQSLGSIIQNPMMGHSKKDVNRWLKEVWKIKAELDKLIEATVELTGFTLTK